MIQAKDILERKGHNVLTIAPDASVLEAAQRMNEHHVGAVMVVEPTALGVVGIFSERDMLRRVVCEGRSPTETHVSEVMTQRLYSCRLDTSLEECRNLMTGRRFRHLPVIENGRLMGMISIGDIMAFEVAAQQTTIDYLHGYIHGRM